MKTRQGVVYFLQSEQVELKTKMSLGFPWPANLCENYKWPYLTQGQILVKTAWVKNKAFFLVKIMPKDFFFFSLIEGMSFKNVCVIYQSVPDLVNKGYALIKLCANWGQLDLKCVLWEQQ